MWSGVKTVADSQITEMPRVKTTTKLKGTRRNNGDTLAITLFYKVDSHTENKAAYQTRRRGVN